MMGDLILFVTLWLHQNIFCVHQYGEEKHLCGVYGHDYVKKTCTRCDREKIREI